MRIVDPAEFEPRPGIESVLTAAMASSVMATLLPAMKDVDPYDAPGPAKIAALETNLGSTMFVVYHEEQQLLELLAPIDEHSIANLSEVLAALRVPHTAIEWVHPKLSQAELLARDLLPPRKVLIVEDNVVAQGLLRDLLESNGYSVQVVSSEDAFGDVLAATDPDVILLDSSAVDPGKLHRHVAGQGKDIPLVVVGDAESSAAAPNEHWQPPASLTKARLLDALADAHSG